MTSFLNTLSGQFAKNILMGTLFPVVLFVIAMAAVVLPLAGITPHAMFETLFLWDQDSLVPALTTFVLVVTFVIFALNIPLIRLYEGYPWQNSLLGQWSTKRQLRRANLLKQIRDRARILTRQAREKDVSNALPDDFSDLLNLSGRARSAFPVRETSILPTRLGNVIRAFEGYANVKYGIDAIMLWPRLAEKLPKDTSESLDSAKASFDFMLNCSVLSILTAAAVLTAGLVRHHPFTSSYLGGWPVQTACFCALAYLSYLGAINRAASWGMEVKVAFDLYRFDLLTGLGYKTEISGPVEERALWEQISFQFLYPDAPNLTPLPYKTGQTELRPFPLYVVLSSERSVTWEANQIQAVTIKVTNADQFRRSAQSVTIAEKIAKGFRVVPNSVELDTVQVAPRATDPLVVGLGPLSPAASKSLIYKVQRI